MITVWAGVAANPTAPVSKGDVRRGATLYEANCSACHSLDNNRVGPAHRGVFGRKAGAVPGFTYSPALKRARVSWTQANLNRWLTNPVAMVPGTRMGFCLRTPQDRKDIIAYLRSVSIAPSK